MNSFTRSAAAWSKAEETTQKRPKSLLGAFNGTDTAVLYAAAAAAAAAAAELGGRLSQNTDTATAAIAELALNAEKTLALHECNPGAGDGNSRPGLTIKITYPYHLARTEVSVTWMAPTAL